MAQRPDQNQNWYLRECISYNPKVRVEISNPTFGYLGANNYLLYSVTDKQQKSSLAFSESGTVELNSDESINIIAGERSGDKAENVFIHSRRGNVTITADRTGTVRVSGNHILVEGDGDIEYIAGNDFSIKANNIKLNGNSVNTQAMSGNQAPLEQQFLYQVFKNAKGVGGGLIGKALGIILG
jgi:hypothetical protein